MASTHKTSGRAVALDTFLESVCACCTQDLLVKAPNPYRLKVYLANGRMFVVLEHLSAVNGVVIGFEIFVAASSENKVSVTLDAVRDYIAHGSPKRSGPISRDELTEIGERITLDQLDELKGMFP